MLPNALGLCAPFIVDPELRILDIGSGGLPFVRATTVVDPFPEDAPDQNYQRGGGQFKQPEGVEYVQAFGEDLPFEDQSFDFVYCSETLNHCNDPVKVIEEMKRVAPAGYIDVPSATLDLFEPHVIHLWRCFDLGGEIEGQHHLGFNRREPGDGILKRVETFIGHLTWAREGMLYQEYAARVHRVLIGMYIQFVWSKPEDLYASFFTDEQVLPNPEGVAETFQRLLGGAGQ